MTSRFNLERIAEDGGSGMRGRTQPNFMRPKRDSAIENVGSPVVERNADGHREPFKGIKPDQN
jgi:hypothetical protein